MNTDGITPSVNPLADTFQFDRGRALRSPAVRLAIIMQMEQHGADAGAILFIRNKYAGQMFYSFETGARGLTNLCGDGNHYLCDRMPVQLAGGGTWRCRCLCHQTQDRSM